MPGSLIRFPRARGSRPSGGIQSPGRRQFAAVLSVLAVVAAVLASATAASAAARSSYWGQSQATYWVSSGAKSKAADTSCRTAAYSTIQSAVNAAEAAPPSRNAAPVIQICPGTYPEQVTITKSMTLTRASDEFSRTPVTIELPASVGLDQKTGLSSTNCQADDSSKGVSAPQSVIEVCAAGASGANTTGTDVTISDVTIEGNWPGSACYGSLYDVLVEGGARLSLTDSTVEKAGAVSPLSGCQGGIGVQVGNSTTGQTGHAELTGDTIKSYQKGGVAVKGSGSTAAIDRSTVTGAGPTTATAQNGIEFVYGATGTVTDSTVSGNNYTGANGASAAGILTYGGCGSALVEHTKFTGNRLDGNDMGIALSNEDSTCSKPATTPSDDLACDNVIKNSHGYSGGTASADANTTGWKDTAPVVGYQAGISDTGDRDVICDNAISGAGYLALGATSSLPNPPPPAFVRPIDTVSGPTTDPQVYGNTYDGHPYNPA